MTVYMRDDAYILFLKSGIHLSARKDTSKDSHSDCSVRQNSKMHSRYKELFQKEKRGLYSMSPADKREWTGMVHNWTEEVRN